MHATDMTHLDVSRCDRAFELFSFCIALQTTAVREIAGGIGGTGT